MNIDAGASKRTAVALGRPLADVRNALLHYHLQDRTIGYLSGHVPFTTEVAVDFSENWEFVTVLRSPVDRFLSEYLYNRHKAQEHFHVDQELEPFLESDEARRVGSQMVNFLTGRTNVYSLPTDHDVSTAVANLDRFAVVGLTERLDSLVADITHRFGRTPVIRRLNRSPAPELARAQARDPDILRRIEALTEGDARVYEYAVRLVSAR